jgi:hypothetical protein
MKKLARLIAPCELDFFERQFADHGRDANTVRHESLIFLALS